MHEGNEGRKESSSSNGRKITVMIFFVGWTNDVRAFQLLGSYNKDTVDEAIEAAATNHGREGRYIAMPASELVQKDVVFDKTAILSDPPPDAPPPTA
jgi:hypothetical protein